MDEEVEGLAREVEVAGAVDGVEGPEGVAAEEPAVAGAGRCAGAEPAGDEAGFEVVGILRMAANPGLFDSDLGPCEGLVEVRVRGVDLEATVEVVGVEVGGLLVLLLEVLVGTAEGFEHGQALGLGVGGGGSVRDGGEQGEELAGVGRGIEVELELERVGGGFFLIGRQDAGFAACQGNEAEELRIVGGKGVEAACRGAS